MIVIDPIGYSFEPFAATSASRKPPYDLQSKLRKGGYTGNNIGGHFRG